MDPLTKLVDKTIKNSWTANLEEKPCPICKKDTIAVFDLCPDCDWNEWVKMTEESNFNAFIGHWEGYGEHGHGD